MSNGKIACFLIIFQAIFIENKMHQERSSFINKLVSFGSNNRSQNLSQVDLVPFEADLPWRHKCTTESVTSSTRRTWQNQARFINIDEYGSDALKQMETLVGKSADFDLIMEDDGVENNGNDDNDYDAYKTGDDEEAEEEEEEEDGEEEDDDEEYSFNILDGDEEEPKKRKKTKKNKVKKNDDDDDDYDDTPQLKHYFKHKLKMKDIMFLLLLAYKLKFVTLIPLFLGAVILLVGTTSMAGFFFALFSAALGLQSRSGRR